VKPFGRRYARLLPSPVGTVAAIWRYPVKSMAGEPLDAVDVSWHGLEGDRRWAFVRDDVPRSGFPWLTIRERPELVLYRPRIVDATHTLVRTPAGEELDVLDLPLGRPIKLDRGAFDSAPLSLITTRSAGGYDVRRFRPNLVIESDAAEEDWVGAELEVGGIVLRVDRPDPRCVIVNVDPDTGERDPSVLKAVAPCIGAYGSTVRPGRVAVGDPVLVKR
jgi:uncharacterized protein